MEDIVIGRSASDREKLGTKGTILLGKHYITMGRTTSLSNNIYMDVTGSHVVFICGKRGGGKCLTGDSLITLGDGTLKRIDELELDDHEILSLDQNLKITKQEKEGFYKRTVPLTYKITLKTGKQIRLTPKHPLLTVNGWKNSENLSIGSRIATPRCLSAFGEENLSEEKVKILAYLIAEGHLGNGFIIFSNKDNKIMQDFIGSVRSMDKELEIKDHGPCSVRVVNNSISRKVTGRRDSNGRFTDESIFINQNSLREFLENIKLYDTRSKSKFIPPEIFRLPKQKLSIFLNRLFSCDGSIFKEKKNYWKLSYSSISETLIRQVQHLLLRFGIISKIRTKNHSAFEIEIKGGFVKLFLEEIGFFGKKEIRQTIAIKETCDTTRNPNLDTIPKDVWELFQPENWTSVGKEMGYKHPKSFRESIRYSPSRQKLLQIAKIEHNDLLMKFATSDIYWDEIISIEAIEEDVPVYDITVPGTHNFVASDIIVHNSYTMGVIAEGMSSLPKEIKQNVSIIMLDTMGVYWTMKYPNHKDEILLKEWGLEGKGLDVKIYTPTKYFHEYKEQGIPTDMPFAIKPSELNGNDWAETFEISINDPMGVVIERVITDLKDAGVDYSLDDIIEAIRKYDDVDENTKNAVENRFNNANNWGVFDVEGTALKDIAKGGQVTVLDVSCYATLENGWKIKALVVGLVAQKLFNQRMIARKDEEYKQIHTAEHYFSEPDSSEDAQTDPLVWLVIDEAHEFMPVTGKTAASFPLITILREGRQPGISLILATQQPGKIHTDVMTQSDTVISHRITAKLDVEALGMLMQSYMREGLTQTLDNLPRVKGVAVVFDDTNEKMYPMKVRPRFTWHGGGSPSAIHEKKHSFEF